MARRRRRKSSRTRGRTRAAAGVLQEWRSRGAAVSCTRVRNRDNNFFNARLLVSAHAYILPGNADHPLSSRLTHALLRAEFAGRGRCARVRVHPRARLRGGCARVEERDHPRSHAPLSRDFRLPVPPRRVKEKRGGFFSENEPQHINILCPCPDPCPVPPLTHTVFISSSLISHKKNTHTHTESTVV